MNFPLNVCDTWRDRWMNRLLEFLALQSVEPLQTLVQFSMWDLVVAKNNQERRVFERRNRPTHGLTDQQIDRLTHGPTDRPSFREARKHLKTDSERWTETRSRGPEGRIGDTPISRNNFRNSSTTQLMRQQDLPTLHLKLFLKSWMNEKLFVNDAFRVQSFFTFEFWMLMTDFHYNSLSSGVDLHVNFFSSDWHVVQVYKIICPSLCPPVHSSVRPFVRPSVRPSGHHQMLFFHLFHSEARSLFHKSLIG